MNWLSDTQVAFIEARLAERGLRDGELRNELLDHLCCVVEEQLAVGYPFAQAVEIAFALFPPGTLKRIESETDSITLQKKTIMKATTLFVFSLLLSIPTYLWVWQIDPPTIAPLAGPLHITSGFGERMHPLRKVKLHHRGVDFRAPYGTPVVATGDGVVAKVERQPTGYGNRIIIRHDEQFQTSYGQLAEIQVVEGQSVKRREVIGTVGSSGDSTGPHLHYEVMKDGQAQNPEAYFQP